MTGTESKKAIHRDCFMTRTAEIEVKFDLIGTTFHESSGLIREAQGPGELTRSVQV